MARLRSLLLMVPAASLAACAVGPNYRPASSGALGVPDQFSVAADARAQEDLSAWWTRFDDPLLTRLVEQARADNLDVAQAMSRLRQAHEGLMQSRAQFLPPVSGSGGYSRSFDIAGARTVKPPDGPVTMIGSAAGRAQGWQYV